MITSNEHKEINLTDSSLVNRSDNVLCQIFSNYPNVWREPNRFKALLMDLLPHDKLKRNLLCICIEEKIPDGLLEKKTITNMEASTYIKKLINACGCTEVLAEQVISLWIEAFNVLVEKPGNIEIDQIKLEELELSIRSYNCLKRAGKCTLADLAKMTLDDFKHIRNLGRKSTEEVLAAMKRYGIEPIKRTDENERDMESADSKWENYLIDDLDLSVRAYNLLKRAGINTVGDIIYKAEDYVRIRNLERKSFEEINNKLISVGVSKEIIDQILLAMDKLREERDKQQKKKELEDEVTDLGNQLQQLQIQVQLTLSAKKLKEGDFPGSIDALEKAVKLGYKGDYSFLGTAYLTGINGVQTDFSKGFSILSKFYDEFKEGMLDIDDKGCMVQVCHNLATCYLWELQEGNTSGSLRQYKLNNILELFREAVDFAPEEKDEDNSSTSAEMLMVIGCCFYYGEIHSEGHDNVTIPMDYEYAYKAFKEAERLGNVQAISLLAEMYEEGKYVEKDIAFAKHNYMRALLKSDKKASEWYQKHYIDNLPWDKCQNWESILLSEVLPEGMAESAKDQGELVTLEDIHRLDFSNLKGRSTFKAIRLPQILKLVGKFVVEYKPGLEESIKSNQ